MLWCNPFAESSRFDHHASLKPDRLQISVLTWLFQRRASCLGEVCKFRDLRAQIQRELPFSSPAKQLWETLAGFGTQATLEAMTEGVGRKDAKDRDRRWVPRFAKVWDRFSTRNHCLFFFFFFPPDRQNRTEAPSPGSPNWVSRYSWCTGSYEHKQMLQRNVSIAQLFQACLSIFSSEDVLVRTQTL